MRQLALKGKGDGSWSSGEGAGQTVKVDRVMGPPRRQGELEEG